MSVRVVRSFDDMKKIQYDMEKYVAQFTTAEDKRKAREKFALQYPCIRKSAIPEIDYIKCDPRQMEFDYENFQ